MVMFTFPSEAHAVAWYNDPDYQALSEHRRAGTELKFLTMVHGLPHREVISPLRNRRCTDIDRPFATVMQPAR